jgi:ribokinase
LHYLFPQGYDFDMHVVGIGQCSLDYLFIVESFPVPDTKNEVSAWTMSGGGPVATALASLSRLGVTCSFFGIIGDDESGIKIRESLEHEKIKTDGLIERPQSHSQTAFIAVEKKSGSRTIFWKRPSGSPLIPPEMPGDFLKNADFLLLDGLMAEVSVYAAKKARAQDIPVMLDAGREREGMRELISFSDYVVASEEFGKDILGQKNRSVHSESFRPEDALQKIRSFGAQTCTLTLGDRGSVTLSGSSNFHVPAFKADIVDTTGAGDVFHGGYIYGLLQSWDLRDVVKFAAAFAALKCRKLGGRAGIPGLEEVKTFLEEQ